ncbi:hypothetical protein LINPERPRIM_LOCUS8790 [Linum perenne]
MEVAWFLGIRRLHIQCDSLLAVKLLLQKGEPLHQYSALILASRELCKCVWSIRIYREANRAVNFLANLGHSLDLGTHLFYVPNVGLLEWLRYDLLAYAYPIWFRLIILRSSLSHQKPMK